MQDTQLSIIIASVIAVLVQVVKDRWHLGNNKWFPAIIGALAAGLTQAGRNTGVDSGTATQALVGGLIPWAVHSGILHDSPLGDALKAFGGVLAKKDTPPPT